MKKFCFSDNYFISKNLTCKRINRVFKTTLFFENRNKFQITKNQLLFIDPSAINSFYVSNSNYLLQKDLIDLKEEEKNVDIKIFNEKKEIIIYSKKEIEQIMKKTRSYLLRNYLNFINYKKLNSIGLERIEQYLILLYSNYLTFFNYQGLLLSNKKDYILNLTNNKTKHSGILGLKANKISTIEFILFVSNVKNKSPFFVIDALYKEYFFNLHITNPFSNNFQILEKDFIFYSEYNLLLNLSTKIEDLIYEGVLNENKKIKYCLLEEKNQLDNNEIIAIQEYFNLLIVDKNNSNNQINIDSSKLVKKNIYSLYFLFSYNYYYIPFEDFMTSLYSLLKLEYIIFTKQGNIYPNPKIKKYFLFNENLTYLSLKDILDKFKQFTEDKEVFELPSFPLINILSPSFICPICKNKQYYLTHDFLTCKDKDCDFYFNRNNLKKQGTNKVLLKDIIKGLVFGNIFIENSNKMKKLYTVKEYASHKYSFTLKTTNLKLI